MKKTTVFRLLALLTALALTLCLLACNTTEDLTETNAEEAGSQQEQGSSEQGSSEQDSAEQDSAELSTDRRETETEENSAGPLEDADPTGLGLWEGGKSTEGASFTRTAPGSILLSLSIKGDADTEQAVEKDACAVLFGQYLSSLYAFDYEAHFKAFPSSLVEKRFTSQVAAGGLDYAGALGKIEAAARKLAPFDSFHISYGVDYFASYLPDDPGFKARLSGYEGWFADAEQSLEGIEEIREYFFTDVAITLNEQYTQLGDPGLSLDRGFRFYKHEGRWYYWPSSIDDDLSVDLALAAEGAPGYFEVGRVGYEITAVEGDYLSFGDNIRYYLPGASEQYLAGDRVMLDFHRGFGMYVETAEGRLTLYRGISTEPVG